MCQDSGYNALLLMPRYVHLIGGRARLGYAIVIGSGFCLTIEKIV